MCLALAFEEVALADLAVPFGVWLGRGDWFRGFGGCGGTVVRRCWLGIGGGCCGMEIAEEVL